MRNAKLHATHTVLHVALAVALIVALATAPLSINALTHQSKAPKIPVPAVNQHLCVKKDYAMGCALPQATVGEIVRGVDPVAQGVDFGWSCPVSVAKDFGASYLSYDSSKDWTRSCVNAFHAAHKGIVAVWEAGANDAQGSYSLGYSQAKQAASELAALGAPSNQPFDMAIDCDCAGSTLVNYFRGANVAEPGRINAYGGYYQIQYLYGQHLVGHLNWQTYAWSGGQWLPASVAPLEQYLNSSKVDYDRCIASNCGQWPPPKPPLSLCARTMCLSRFTSLPINVRSGPCEHGCVERQYVTWWQRAQHQSHAHRLWLRYRIQVMEKRLEYLLAHGVPADNAINRRGQRAHILWAIGFRAAFEKSYVGYLHFK